MVRERPRELLQALEQEGVVCDFRAPNVIRVAPIPLYTTYDEIWRTIQALREIMETGEHRQFAAERAAVS